MNLRALRYFTALARERHFARAADRCGVSQPTLSAALTSLEAELGKRLIDRDRRYLGLTPEGEAVLPWAQQMLAAHDALLQSVELVSGPLTGELRIGSIPAALPLAGAIASLLLEAYSLLSVSVRSLTSQEILLGLSAFELDAGVSYLTGMQTPEVISEPLAIDSHYFVSLRHGASPRNTEMMWDEAAGHPLCLLHGGMHHRRIIDAAFRHHSLEISPRATADSFITLLAMVRTGQFSTIITGAHRFLIDGLDWADVRPLQRSPDGQAIGMIILNRAPLGALASTALRVARRYAESQA
ncbi:MAG TPA: LysR family transcriptional regulator [Sphingobium sp.]